ncbi:tRNA(Ile)-lysidine synthase [Antricoccus suffuscus]|uniref:tRNA(Ile)-lysidine synthase n=1 Tax=Antricoccus suffuscus TaxID=1629062 RepID=A0A2T1A3H3_9ACTN|nr:tRNA lysidine(34) synthetase TilS [Antricoccus suffuscus]PRZ43161.1 tRNA(Ile)-lysidine synthase [Antricoccus suffuscus]
MVGPPPAVAAVRVAVRRWLENAGHDQPYPPAESLCVAVSGGADSLALLTATIFEAGKLGLEVDALSVDHQLQDGSAARAAQVADLARRLGARSATVCTVTVAGTSNIEAQARTARYAALAAQSHGRWILLGHTLDDQAESVLLGLGRGSGPRAIAGMSAHNFPYGRPLLTVRRAQTRSACRDEGLPIWDDPHNDDPRFTRVRIRNEALPLLEEILGGGVAEALATTAELLQHDDRAVGELALRALDVLRADPVPDMASALRARALADHPAGLRRRIIKLWLEKDGGFGSLTGPHIAAVDALVADYHGQGPAYLPGGRRVTRTRETINLTR